MTWLWSVRQPRLCESPMTRFWRRYLTRSRHPSWAERKKTNFEINLNDNVNNNNNIADDDDIFYYKTRAAMRIDMLMMSWYPESGSFIFVQSPTLSFFFFGPFNFCNINIMLYYYFTSSTVLFKVLKFLDITVGHVFMVKYFVDSIFVIFVITHNFLEMEFRLWRLVYFRFITSSAIWLKHKNTFFRVI